MKDVHVPRRPRPETVASALARSDTEEKHVPPAGPRPETLASPLARELTDEELAQLAERAHRQVKAHRAAKARANRQRDAVAHAEKVAAETAAKCDPDAPKFNAGWAMWHFGRAWSAAATAGIAPPGGASVTVLVALAFHADEKTGSSFPSLLNVAEGTGLGRSTAKKHLMRLEALGLIYRTPGGGRGNATVYTPRIAFMRSICSGEAKWPADPAPGTLTEDAP